MNDTIETSEELNHRILELQKELENFEGIIRHLRPHPGEVPAIPGIDVFGVVRPHAGPCGGDHIIYLDFNKRYDLDIRIERAKRRNRPEAAAKLVELKRTAGVLLADVSGHQITDAVLAAMLHQSFLLGVPYELEMSGEVTVKLFENINNRFFRSGSVRKFLTMVYGEIHTNGTFRFISAGHPPPMVFSNEFDRFVDISPDLIDNFPPIGMMPSETDLDLSRARPLLGTADSPTINELRLMMPGDILILYTDGLSDHGGRKSPYFPGKLEDALRAHKKKPARTIVEEILRDVLLHAATTDDLSFVVIKKN
jgi:serine phosphatase RsbU (regulator of sigma subunit)